MTLSDLSSRVPQSGTDSQYRSVYKWGILALLYLGMLVVTLVIQGIPPMLADLEQEFGLRDANAGLLMGLISLPGLFLSMLVGSFSDRYGFKRVGVYSLVLIVVGILLMSTTVDFGILCVGRVVSGIGVVALAIALPYAVAICFKDSRIGLAMGIFNTALPLGTILSYSFLGELCVVWGWRIVLLSFAVLAVVNLVFLLFMYPSVNADRNRPSRGSVVSNVFRVTRLGRTVWLLAMIWMFYNAAMMGFSTFGPTYFRQMGFPVGESGFFSSVVTWGALVFSPLTGYVLDRGLREKWLLLPSCLLLVSVFLMLASGQFPLALSLAFLGIAAGLIPAPIYYLLPRAVSQENIGLGYGAVMTALHISLLCGPWLTGLVDQRYETPSAGFVLMAVFMVFASIACLIPGSHRD